MTYNILDVIKDELTGTAEYVSHEEKLRRLSICLTCEHLKKLSRQCGKCGCFVDMKTKYAEAECDADRWNH